MKLAYSILLALLWFYSGIVSAKGAKTDSDADYRIYAELSKDKLYEGETGFLTIYLNSKSPDVSYLREIASPAVLKGEGLKLSRINRPRNIDIMEKDGKEFYRIPLTDFLLVPESAGKYTISGGEYNLGVAIPVIVNDPFWGRTRTVNVKDVRKAIDAIKIEVKKLPENKAEGSFSGAVGDFEVAVTIPEGDIIVNESATALIIVKGKGILDDDVMPDYRNAFAHDTRLKSVSEDVRTYFEGDDLISVKEIVCEFIPEKSGECELQSVKFEFFNPATGKYEQSESGVVKFNVKSSVSKRKTMSI